MDRKTSLPAIMALVDAIAGITFLTTPWVNCQVTPSILNSAARFEAMVYNHSIWSGSSVSSFLSTHQPDFKKRRVWRKRFNEPLKTFGHSRTDAHSMQCSGSRGVLAIVQIGYAVAGVIRDIWLSTSFSSPP